MTSNRMKVTMSVAVLAAGVACSGSDNFSITGTVTGASEVLITLTGAATATATTNVSGGFSFSGLANGDYSLTPSKTGYAFSPPEIAAKIDGADVSDRNFTASPLASTRHSVSGTVTLDGVALQGVNMTLSLGDIVADTLTTAADGSFTFAELDDATYKLAPSLEGYTFDPELREVQLAGADVADQDFAASLVTYTVSGTIHAENLSIPVTGITLTLSSSSDSLEATTNEEGFYQFTGVKRLTSYALIPTSPEGYTIAPHSISIFVTDRDATGRDFTISVAVLTHAISGNIWGISEGMTVAVALTNPNDTSFYIDALVKDGTYSISPVEDGDWDLTPMDRMGICAFSPAPPYRVKMEGSDLTADFTMSCPQTYTVLGTIVGYTGNQNYLFVQLADDVNHRYFEGAMQSEGDHIVFTIEDVVAGTYILSFGGAPGCHFTPNDFDLTVGGNMELENPVNAACFPVYRISGKVKNLAPMSVGGKVTLSSEGEKDQLSLFYAYAGGAVAYQFVAEDGTYSITPLLQGCTFSPPLREVEVSGQDLPDQDFDSACVPVFYISGSIAGAPSAINPIKLVLTGNGITNEAFAVSGGEPSSGGYGFVRIPDGNYSITPEVESCTFDPTSREVTVNGANVRDQNFTFVNCSP